jgi:hypothetical protein
MILAVGTVFALLLELITWRLAQRQRWPWAVFWFLSMPAAVLVLAWVGIAAGVK